mgnify:CR=1 FL=1
MRDDEGWYDVVVILVSVARSEKFGFEEFRDILFCFSSRRRHTTYIGDWSSDVCSSDLRDSAQNQTVLLALATTEVPIAPPSLRMRKVEREIGRASCRERVYISGVHSTVKKNSTKMTCYITMSNHLSAMMLTNITIRTNKTSN